MTAAQTAPSDHLLRTSDRLALEQLRLALHNLKPNVWIMPIFSAVICLMFTRWITAPMLALWYAIVLFGGVPLGIIAHRFPRHSSPETDHGRWVVRAALAYFLFTLSWSSFSWLFWRSGDDQNNLLILLLIGCTLAGNSALVGASRPLTINGYVVYGLALVVLPLRTGGMIYDSISVMALLFVGYMAMMSRQIYSTARDMLMLRNDKDGLIAALAKSKTRSEEALARAEAANRTKSEFLANMSHELRTPLNAIIGFSEMIHSRAFGSNIEKHVEYGLIIHQSGHHLLALINDILDLAKIEAGGLRLQESEFDLVRLIAECAGLMAAKAQSGGIVLRPESRANACAVHADERALRQILLNLLSNAVKFTPRGGLVTAFLRADATGEIVFGVRDTGHGIREEDRARIFESFGQGRHDVAMQDKGTGLGLPIVKGLVEAHGGRVELDSRVGDGTCVTVILPAVRSRPTADFRAAS